MGLRLKFNLALSIVAILGLVSASYLGKALLQDNAREEVLEKARIIMQSADSIRHYTLDEIKPLLAVQQRRQFLPQTVPAYAAHTYVQTLQDDYPDYSYKEATLNPTNPDDLATHWEAEVIQAFRNNEALDELVGERETLEGPFLYLGHPISVDSPACLACHSHPSQAPKTMIDKYGSKNGFGWQMNEIVGAQLVSVPMSLPLARAEHTFFVFLGVLIAVFIIIGIILNIMLHFIIIKPVKALSKTADAVSLGKLNAEEVDIKGSDEIASLGRSFNRMHRSLSNAMTMLDETIDD